VVHVAERGLLAARLAPPPQQASLLPRPRVAALLANAANYPLTLLCAPAGSGKTTALAQLAANASVPLAWCRASADDDPALLLLHMAAAFRGVAPLDESRIQQALAESTTADGHDGLDVLANELAASLNEPTLLVLDDYQLADANPVLRGLVERLLAIQPMRLRLVLATRYAPELAPLATARARGEVYQCDQAELAFTPAEAADLFALNQCPLPPDVDAMLAWYRGWPLALQLALHEGRTVRELHALPPDSDRAIPLLDAYLSQHVLHDQPPALQAFLLHTAGLRWLDPALCAELSGATHSNDLLAQISQRGLFVEMHAAGHLAYQPFFQAFLQRLAAEQLEAWPELHRRAAAFYQAQRDDDGVLHHLLRGGGAAEAALVLAARGPAWLEQGRAEALVAWLEQLAEPQRSIPALLELRAAALRQLGRFEVALQVWQSAGAAYQRAGDRAGQVRALRGRAEVYLDTVQPAPAVALLKQACKLLPRTSVAERAELLRMQAENWANQGRADVALILERAAQQLQPDGKRQAITPVATNASATLLPPRLLLRSGNLLEARDQLESSLGMRGTWQARAEAVPSAMHPFAMHREPLLLLSFIYGMLGNGPRALAMAQRGLLEATQGGSQLTQAIAFMRAGHALQLVPGVDGAAVQQHYSQALRLAEAAGVQRTKVEILLGLTLLHAYGGDMAAAEGTARDGLQIAAVAGDAWVTALLYLALGGAAVTSGDERAPGWLDEAQQRFARGGDSYGQAVVALWYAIWHGRQGQEAGLRASVTTLLELVRNHGYEGLLTAPTLFGPRDLAMLVPLLLFGRSLPPFQGLAQQLLRQAFPTIAADETVEDYHPGFTLRVQMLGSFRVWRGNQEVQSREWQREKARQLFQLLLTYRGHWIQREQICAWLWPESDQEAAERQFKVTLNALNSALEPHRPPRVSPFFIRRQGLAYSFAPSYGVWIDVDEFELRAAGATAGDDPDFARRNSQIAVQLYRGDYLTEALYDLWTLEERERLLARFLATTTTHAMRVLERGDVQQAVQLCEQVLRRDRCYEEAYQVLMRAHARSGSRSQAIRSYARCLQALHDDLGIDPLPESSALYEQIKQNKPV
jgi:DNA-binding SARP family transcriptional activator